MASVTIDNTGLVSYEAERFGNAEPNDSIKISQEEYYGLTTEIMDNYFFTLQNEYPTRDLLDSSTFTITVKRNGQSKSVSCYGTCPKEFNKILDKIRKVWGKEIAQEGV